MNTARLEYCKKLYELSGWNGENTNISHWWVYREYSDGSGLYVLEDGHAAPFATSTYPAYDLGLLLRKLPPQTVIKKEHDANPGLPKETPEYYRALYDTADGQHFWLGADTPEDAACRLAIALFEQGILKVED